MRARRLLIGAVSVGLVSGSLVAYAQEPSDDVQDLPRIEVTPGTKRAKPSQARGVRRVAREAPRVVVPTAPTAGSGIDADKVPAGVNVVTTRDIERTNSLNIVEALEQKVAGVSITEVAGNPFQPNVEFRGFVASPVPGTPQGLAVYQNGTRINEAFGDTVNWDMIPTAAIRSVTVVTNNPAFGLNALGGAVDLQMKDGFSYRGAEINTMGGSFGRVQSSAQWGKTRFQAFDPA